MYISNRIYALGLITYCAQVKSLIRSIKRVTRFTCEMTVTLTVYMQFTNLRDFTWLTFNTPTPGNNRVSLILNLFTI